VERMAEEYLKEVGVLLSRITSVPGTMRLPPLPTPHIITTHTCIHTYSYTHTHTHTHTHAHRGAEGEDCLWAGAELRRMAHRAG
jgi:hypothetical protein